MYIRGHDPHVDPDLRRARIVADLFKSLSGFADLLSSASDLHAQRTRSARAAHARPLHPAALAFVSYAICHMGLYWFKFECLFAGVVIGC